MAKLNKQQDGNELKNRFTSQLKGWWDNYLAQEQRQAILTAMKQDQNETPILDSTTRQPISDVVTTLVTAITHFIGNTQIILERSKELLFNLLCPTLTHFHWYEDIFLSKLYQRHDTSQDFLKEWFIARLPILFAEKVKTRIHSKHNGQILYNQHTLGEIIFEIYAEGLS
ncbi:hypothetical protein ACSBR1_033959 [Camellia fascicularis]